MDNIEKYKQLLVESKKLHKKMNDLFPQEEKEKYLVLITNKYFNELKALDVEFTFDRNSVGCGYGKHSHLMFFDEVDAIRIVDSDWDTVVDMQEYNESQNKGNE